MNFKLVMTPDFHEAEQRGVFDHWIGETVPLRGPNREIIGEATVTDLDHRADGIVYVSIETSVTILPGEALRKLSETIAGKPSMSFSVKPEDVVIPHQPKRDDDVARWLIRARGRYDHDMWDSENLDDLHSYQTINSILDDYRARADYGLTLDNDLSELPEGY